MLDKLDMALLGYMPGDPISEFVFTLHKAGIPLGEEDARGILKDVPLVVEGLTPRVKRTVYKVIELIRNATTPQQRESGNVPAELVREIVVGTAPILGTPRYRDILRQMVEKIVEVLPMVDLIMAEPPGSDDDVAANVELGSRLADVPKIEKTPVSQQQY